MDIRGISLEQAPSKSVAGTKPGASPVATAPAISVSGLGHGFGSLDVLRDVALEVGSGEIVALVGPSGCGKSTLLELIGGLAEPRAGRIVVEGDEASPARLERCAWMPQRDGLLPWRRAIDNAALGPRIAGSGHREAREQASAMLDRLGLGAFEDAYPSELSGGMRQRVAFARTLLTGKPVLLLDEPFAALDAITRADLQSWLRATLLAEGRSTLLVTHDVEEALYVADRVMLMSPRPGQITWQARSPQVPPDASRATAVSEPAFVAARAEALAALELGGLG